MDRSKWRYLNEKEVRTLKYLNISVFKDNVKKQRMQDNEEADRIIQKDKDVRKSSTQVKPLARKRKASKIPEGDD